MIEEMFAVVRENTMLGAEISPHRRNPWYWITYGYTWVVFAGWSR